MSKPLILQRSDFAFFLPIQTRWADNDMYGHVNNVTYYSYFDTAANALLIEKTHFDAHHSPMIGLVVNSSCDFLQELSYPEIIDVGVSIIKIGRSSLTYRLAIFKRHKDQAAAQGQFVHVFVDHLNRQSVEIPDAMRQALQPYLGLELSA